MTYQKLKKLFIDILEGQWIKLALKQLLGSAAVGGIKGWAVRLLATYLFTKYIGPMVKSVWRWGHAAVLKSKGKKQSKKIKEAKESHDQAAYDDAVDDVFE